MTNRPADAIGPLRVGLTYLWRHRRPPKLARPTLFTELVQHRKLNDRDPRLPILADKVAVKAFVADRIGADWVIPTLWHGLRLPDRPPCPLPVIVKARHGCNQNAIARDGAGWARARRLARRWTARRYGYWLDEWLYRDIPRGVLIEPLLGGDRLPLDYKLYVFGGRVEYVQVHFDRAADHRWIVFDRIWRRVSSPTRDDPPPPASLDRMIAAAETLAHGFSFVRIDLYEIDGRPLFGEMTFYPGSGLDPFDPLALDARLGEQWLSALGAVGVLSRGRVPAW